MGSSYLKNHLGYSLTEAEFEDIPNPYLELNSHVTMKTIQAGTLLGTLVFGPLAAVRKQSTRNWAGIVQKATRFGRNGMIIGVGLGPLLVYARTMKDPQEKIIDRDFRLRHNRGQVRVDRGAIVGGIIGVGANTLLGKPKLIGGLVGITAGVIGMAVYNINQK
ncbi:hypothetical protein LSH36_740g01073 [Paralvinella palmiformis]|uniref:Uncharacterized protein n=1 Tax=Paralvinella palmiformis TaxID=53620 RepID=A0AAD9J2A4_9ANNE|nr:hypothetical protein LSH36_740g01073 [Paralvinella palmiformis]